MAVRTDQAISREADGDCTRVVCDNCGKLLFKITAGQPGLRPRTVEIEIKCNNHSCKRINKIRV